MSRSKANNDDSLSRSPSQSDVRPSQSDVRPPSGMNAGRRSSEPGWQIDRSVLQCNQYMLEQSVACDVLFRVGTHGEATEDIQAHRYVLISRSPVFEALFMGGLTRDVSGVQVGEGETTTDPRPIEICDVEPEAFRQLLKHIYTEKVDLTPDNVLPILYAAKKYLQNGLAKHCMNFLEDKITVDTVCTILNHSILYDEKELQTKCLMFIALRMRHILKNDSFLGLSSSGLVRLLKTDSLYLSSEVDVLEACIRWAVYRSNTQNATVSDTDIRSLLGENLYRIRFCSMTPTEFAKSLGRRDILSAEEKSRLYYYLLTGDDAGRQGLLDLGFDLSYRIQKCVRYSCLGRTAGWWTCNGPSDAFCFSVDKPIVLVGASLYGAREPGTHKVALEICRGEELIKRSEQKLVSDGSVQPYPVYFIGSELVLTPKEQYTLVAMMKGPITFYGQGGTDTVTARGVTFSFLRDDKSGNGTNVKSGQIPEILFLPKKT